MFDDIYTYTGNILIAVNPFQSVSHLYGQHMMEMYKGQDLGSLSPHVYATAESAYRQMVAAGAGREFCIVARTRASTRRVSQRASYLWPQARAARVARLAVRLSMLHVWSPLVAASVFTAAGCQQEPGVSPVMKLGARADRCERRSALHLGKCTMVVLHAKLHICLRAVSRCALCCLKATSTMLVGVGNVTNCALCMCMARCLLQPLICAIRDC